MDWNRVQSDTIVFLNTKRNKFVVSKQDQTWILIGNNIGTMRYLDYLSYLRTGRIICTKPFVGNVNCLWQMNIQIFFWLQNFTNICEMNIFVYKYLNIQIYLHKTVCSKCKFSLTNEYPNILVALKFYKYLSNKHFCL